MDGAELRANVNLHVRSCFVTDDRDKNKPDWLNLTKSVVEAKVHTQDIVLETNKNTQLVELSASTFLAVDVCDKYSRQVEHRQEIRCT